MRIIQRRELLTAIMRLYDGKGLVNLYLLFARFYREESLPLKNGVHGSQQLLTSIAFGYESLHSGLLRFSDYAVVYVHRKNKDRNLRKNCSDLPSGGKTIRDRHCHV
jgi:hypothetical protein